MGMHSDNQDLKKAIADAADHHGLPPDIVYGVCMQESGGNPLAARYEPAYRWLVHDTRLRPMDCTRDTEEVLQKISWGLMQVMGAVLREQGYGGWLTNVSGDIELQLDAGCKHLARAVRRWGSVEAGLAAYNAGSPRPGLNGGYVNQHYVDSVLRKAKGWQT